ncbi:MAG: hypothetical protein VXY77_02925 [Pseudomonadota bacterium]|nr:hypothetical protein [Pseudomonadota bacterium]
MKTYLVGGAVRDKRLGKSVQERDWVVVGASPQDLLNQGYQQVGKDFPVFLHPQSKEEYALARTERKQGHGYHGFSVDASPCVTLEEDLLRRDLTINAMAEDENGVLIDPYGGLSDLGQKWLRHVSKAFEEDPLRVLRLARFYAKLPGFSIHPDTLLISQHMVASGELSYLTPERVWQEWRKALTLAEPSRFVDALVLTHAWPVVMPGYCKPELDSAVLGRLGIQYGTERFCLLGQYLDSTSYSKNLKHFKAPREIIQLGILINHILSYTKQRSTQKEKACHLLTQFYRWDVFRRHERFQKACVLIEASQLATVGVMNAWSWYSRVLGDLDLKPIISQYKGTVIAQQIREARLALLETLINQPRET